MLRNGARVSSVLLLIGLVAATGSAIGDGADTCAEPPVVIAALPFVDAGDTTGSTNTVQSYGGTCTLPFSYAGEDEIYELSLGVGNNVSLSLDLAGSTGDLALFLIAPCGDGNGCVANSNDSIGPGQGPENIPSASYAPGTYYVYVDSYYSSGTPGSSGTYTLTVEGDLGGETAGDCCVPVLLDCCQPQDGPGCGDPEIEMCVCEVDPFCCSTGWDSICANEAFVLGCTDCVSGDFSCEVLTESECLAADGEFGSEGGSCEPDSCSQEPPEGACCEGLPVSCSITTELECTGFWTEGGDCENACAEPTIPTLGQWGMIIMALLLLTVGSIRFTRQLN